MVFTRKAILGIVIISLLGSVTLAYGLSTEFLFEFDSGDAPTSSTSNSTHIFIANTTTIEIFDLSGNLVRDFDPRVANGDGPPFGVAVNDTHIFVTGGSGSSEIQLYDHAGNFNSTFFSLPATPLAIELNGTHVFVVNALDDRVNIFDLSGIIVDNATSNLGDPTDVAIDSNGRIIVSDDADNRIEIFDSSGNWLDFYGTGEFVTPNGVDVDSNDRIIVSDGSNANVKIFDSSGRLLTTFGDEELVFPSGLTVDSNDRIIVPDSLDGDVKVFAYATENTGGGGSNANKHKTAPTSGNDWNTHNSLVKDGVSVDGKSFNITDNWWTPFEQIQISTSSMHTFTAKTFAQNGGLMIQEFAFGIPSVGEYHNAESIIEVHYNYDKSIDKVVVIQDTEVIEESTIFATTEQVSCDGGSTMCYLTTVHVKFNEPLKDAVYAIKAFDMSRRSMMPHYFNDGVNIVGENMNPLPTKTIPGTIKGEGLITITQIEKYNDLWIAENGKIFEMYGISDSFKHVNQSYERDIDSDMVKSRNHSAYSNWLLWQEKVATGIFDSSLIQGSDKGFIAQPIDEDGIDHRTETLQKLNWR